MNRDHEEQYTNIKVSAQLNNGYLFQRYSSIVEVKDSNFNFSV